MEFRNFEINSVINDENKMTLSIDLSQSKKFPRNCRFQTESINPKVFINGIQKNAVILLNHNKQMVVSNKFNAKETHNGVEVEVDLDPRNVFASTCISYRENEVPLSVSFGFVCKEERMNGKHREVLDLEISELSVLTVESAYPSSVRSLDVSVTLDELKEIINETVKNALEQQKTQEEVVVEEPKVEEKPVEEPKEEKQIVEQVVKLDATGLENAFKTFLDDFKEVVKPQEQPKVEEVVEEKVVEEVVNEPVKPTVDEEKVKADIERYKKMLEEL